MKAYVDDDLCIGCGSCAAVCSAVFQMGDDGKAYAEEDNIDAMTESCVAQAQAICPTSAIKVS